MILIPGHVPARASHPLTRHYHQSNLTQIRTHVPLLSPAASYAKPSICSNVWRFFVDAMLPQVLDKTEFSGAWIPPCHDAYVLLALGALPVRMGEMNARPSSRPCPKPHELCLSLPSWLPASRLCAIAR